MEFVMDLKAHMFIATFTPQKPTRLILIDMFDIIPSRRRRIATGQYSDGKLDDIASQSSTDNTPVTFLGDELSSCSPK
jgi:hypothetical protein